MALFLILELFTNTSPLSDTVIVLNQGKIIKKNKPETIIKEFNTESLHDAFVTLTNTKG